MSDSWIAYIEHIMDGLPLVLPRIAYVSPKHRPLLFIAGPLVAQLFAQCCPMGLCPVGIPWDFQTQAKLMSMLK